MQHHAADELNIKVAHLQGPLAGLAHGGEGLGQQVIQRLALAQTLAELVGLGLQCGVVELFKLGLDGIDLLDGATKAFEQPVIATAENLCEKLGQHAAWA